MSRRFEGRIVPINPKRDTINGLPCFPRIEDAGGGIDVAILAVPAAPILASVESCAAAGVGGCVSVSTGFAEAGEEGAAIQARLQQLCRETGMRIVGPNCMWLINTHHRLALTSSLVLGVPVLPTGPGRRPGIAARVALGSEHRQARLIAGRRAVDFPDGLF